MRFFTSSLVKSISIFFIFCLSASTTSFGGAGFFGVGGGLISYQLSGGANFTFPFTVAATNYTWNATSGTADWQSPASWTPARNTPAITDVLNFTNGGASYATNVPTQTISGINIASGTDIRFETSTNNTLTINDGVSGPDFLINGFFHMDRAIALSIVLSTGATGSVSGEVYVSRGAHTILPADANSLIFNSGSRLEQGTSFLNDFTGNVFGTSGTSNAVRFDNGSFFRQFAGANPFGSAGGRVSFQTGSLYEYYGGSLSFSGRTYGNFTFFSTSTPNPGGSSPVSIDNLSVYFGTLNIGMTGTGTNISSIKGTIEVADGAALNFNGTGASVQLNPASSANISRVIGTTTGTVTVATGQIVNIPSAKTINLQMPVTVNGELNVSGTLNCGTNVISGTGTFTTNGGATFSTQHVDGISSAPTNTGTIQTTTRNFNAGTNYVYNATTNQATGTGLPLTITTGSLTIAATNNSIVTLTNSSATTTPTLNLNSGLFRSGFLMITNGGVINANGGNVISGTITFLGSGTVSTTNATSSVYFDVVRISGGVNFGSATLTSTINSSLVILSGGFVNTTPPAYAVNSQLAYVTGGTYGRGLEFSSNSGKGYPFNVTINNNTALNVGNGGVNTARQIAGDLFILPGSGFFMDFGTDDMTQPVTVLGGVAIYGSLSLSDASGGDLIVHRNWNNSGVFNPKSRAVFFNGTTISDIYSNATAIFDFLFVNKTGGATVSLSFNTFDLQVNNNLTLTSGTIVTGTNKVIISAGSGVTQTGGWVNGNLQKHVATGNNVSRTFEVGNANYTPLSIDFTNVSTAGNLTVNTTNGDHASIATSVINSAKSVNRNWTVTNSGVVFNSGANTAAVTLNWNAADVDGTANTNNFIVGKYDNPTWTYPSASNLAATSIKANGITSFSDFQVGECSINLTFNVTGGGAYCSGGSGVTIGLDDSETGVSYQLKDGSNNNVGAAVVGDGNAISFGLITIAGTYTVTANNGVCSGTMAGNATVTVNATTSSTQSLTICSNQLPYIWDGLTFTEAGTQTKTGLTNTAGCDSTATYNLTVTTAVTWYLDADNDGYYVSSVTACASPGAGYRNSGVIALGDCNDNNANVWLSQPTGLTATGGTGTITASATGATQYSVNGTSYQPTGNFTGLSAGTYTVYARNTANGCVATLAGIVVTGTGPCKLLTPPVTPTPTINYANVCHIINTTTTARVRATVTANTVAYRWKLPAGVVCESPFTSIVGLDSIETTTNYIDIRFESGFVTNSTISVRSRSACGILSTTAKTVTLKATRPSVPTIKSWNGSADVTAIINVCPYYTSVLDPVSDIVQYTIRQDSIATGYTWSVSNGATMTIVGSPNDTIVSVEFSSAFTFGVLTITKTSGCGSYSRTLTIKKLAAAKPGRLLTLRNGTTPTPYVNVCDVVGSATEFVRYQLPSVPAFSSSYIWSVLNSGTSGSMTVVGGGGALDNFIDVRYGAGFTFGSVRVQSVNSCSESFATILTVKATIPIFPPLTTITGATTTGLLCGATNVVLTTSNPATDSTTNDYLWTLPVGVTPNASIPNTFVGAVVGGTQYSTASNSIAIDWNSTKAGKIVVAGRSFCGVGKAISLTLVATPAKPGAITEVQNCPSQFNYTYTIASIPGAVTYTWKVPVGVTIVSGQGTTTLNVNYRTTPAVNGSVSVAATNACGTSLSTAILKTAFTPPVCAGPVSRPGSGIVDGTSAAVEMGAKVIPNPNNGSFVLRIQTANVKDAAQIQVLDIQGRVVLNLVGVNNNGIIQSSINVNQLIPNGNYLVKYIIGKETGTVKMMIQR